MSSMCRPSATTTSTTGAIPAPVPPRRPPPSSARSTPAHVDVSRESSSESSTPNLRRRRIRPRPRRCGREVTTALALVVAASALRSPPASASAAPAAAFAAVCDDRRRALGPRLPRLVIPISPTPTVRPVCGGLIVDVTRRHRSDVRDTELFNSVDDEAAPGGRRRSADGCAERERGSSKYKRGMGPLRGVFGRGIRRRVLAATLAMAGFCLFLSIAAPAAASAYIEAATSSAAAGTAEPLAAAALDIASTSTVAGAASAVAASAPSPPRLLVHRLGSCVTSACRHVFTSFRSSVRHNAEVAARLLYAAMVGGCVGLHRPRSTNVADRSNNGMGTRTFALVALGACMFTLCGTHGLTDMYGIPSTCTNDLLAGMTPSMASSLGPQVKIDVSRMASNVATGVGFIGAGVITSNRRPDGTVDVRGLTTAASVWVSAAVGIAAGAGMYFAAACGMAVTVAVIRWGKVLPSSHSHDVIDRRRQKRRPRRHESSSADVVAAATIPSAADLTDSGLLPPPPSSLDYDYLPAVVPGSSSFANPSSDAGEVEPRRVVKIDPVREVEERYRRISRGREERKGRGDGAGAGAGGDRRHDPSSSASDPQVEGLPMASSSTLLHDGRDEDPDAAVLGAGGGRLTGRGTGMGMGMGGGNQTVWDDCAP